MQPIAANEIDLSHFNTAMAGYGPKNIYAEAVLVTTENIGKLALEFELDLRYMGNHGLGTPFFTFLAKRELEDPIELTVLPNFWIIMLWDEIHIFRDDLFNKTFEVTPAAPKDKSDLDAEERQAALEEENLSPELRKDLEGSAKLNLEGVVGPEEERILNDAKTQILYPDGSFEHGDTRILPAAGKIAWTPPFEKFTEKATGKQVQFRKGVYESLAEGVQSAYEKVEEEPKPEIPQGNLDGGNERPMSL